MVHSLGLRVIIILAVVHKVFSQQNGMSVNRFAYQNLGNQYLKNAKLSSCDSSLPEAVPEQIIKHPDENVIHHTSPIYVERPPTYVRIEHPDIIIEPHPVVYHKPAAVVRSPVIYKKLPQKVQYRQVVKHIVKPIERKIVLKEKQKTKKCACSRMTANRDQNNFPLKYFVDQQADAITDSTNNVQHQQYIQRPAGLVGQLETMSPPDAFDEEVTNERQYEPADSPRVYYKQSFPVVYAQ